MILEEQAPLSLKGTEFCTTIRKPHDSSGTQGAFEKYGLQVILSILKFGALSFAIRRNGFGAGTQRVFPWLTFLPHWAAAGRQRLWKQKKKDCESYQDGS